jgi:hypothetical protein
MFHNASRKGLIALATVATLAAATPARAQFFGWFGARTFPETRPAAPPRAVEFKLRRMGYRLLTPMRFNGDVVLADVVDSGGRRARLVIDPVDGAILQKFATAEPRPSRPLTRDPEFGAAPVVRGPSTGYLENGAAAPLPAPETRAPVAETPRPTKPTAPKKVARAAPAQAPVADAPAAKPVAPAPDKPTTPAAMRDTPAPIAETAPRPNPPAAKPSTPAPPKAGYANGVPINPLD